jgi:hypothetical protein
MANKPAGMEIAYADTAMGQLSHLAGREQFMQATRIASPEDGAQAFLSLGVEPSSDIFNAPGINLLASLVHNDRLGKPPTIDNDEARRLLKNMTGTECPICSTLRQRK